MTEPVSGRKPVLALLMRLLWAAAPALPVFGAQAGAVLTTLYSFTGTNSGAGPYAALVQGSDGNFYGTTAGGGAYTNQNGQGEGTVFKISTNGAVTTLYSFTGRNDGAGPYTGLVQGSDGNFYGTAMGVPMDFSCGQFGTVFGIGTNGALTILHAFTDDEGAEPVAALVQGNDGNFYGTTGHGGTNGGYGTVFKISTTGALTTLYTFTGAYDGANPTAGLVQGSDGYFYGTTTSGGTYGSGYSGYGTVFKISTNGVLTSLYSFTGGNDGASANGLVQGSDSSFYGTTECGGVGGAGTVFRLTILPEFEAVTLTNSTLSLTWRTGAGGRYQLQYNSDLSSSNWTNLRNAVTAAGAALSATDSVTNGPRRFYRVVLSP